MPRLHLCRRAGTGVPGPRGHRRAGGEVRAGRARGRRARLLWPPERLGPGPLSEKAPPAPHPLFSRRRLSPLLSPSPGSSARPAGARRQQEHAAAAAAAARAERAARGEGGARAAARRGGRRGGRASAGEAQPRTHPSGAQPRPGGAPAQERWARRRAPPEPRAARVPASAALGPLLALARAGSPSQDSWPLASFASAQKILSWRSPETDGSRGECPPTVLCRRSALPCLPVHFAPTYPTPLSGPEIRCLAFLRLGEGVSRPPRVTDAAFVQTGQPNLLKTFPPWWEERGCQRGRSA